jgi:hypothetical protein
MNEHSLCAPSPPIQEPLDDDTIRDIQAVQQVARPLRGAHGMPSSAISRLRWVLAVIRTLEERRV